MVTALTLMGASVLVMAATLTRMAAGAGDDEVDMGEWTRYDELLFAFARATRCPRMLLRACYGMSGTEIGYGATTRLVNNIYKGAVDVQGSLLSYAPAMQCPAMSGTDIAYAPSRHRRSTEPDGARSRPP
eukprot:3277001-Rhodomonas_salina.1